jgi:multicomponent K+:H+ antiporter subunit E
MSRLFPHPLLSTAMVLLWLLLTRFSLGHLLLGGTVSLVAGQAFSRLEPEQVRVRAWVPLLRLAGIVTLDIIQSNYAVARLMLTNGRHGERRSGFVEIQLRLDDPVPLALLAVVLTATPGTAWLEYDADSGVLLLHVFDMVDPAEWQELIRDRYEALLLEAFG